MIRVEFSAEEAAEVVRVLEGYLADLRVEIGDTDTSTFKEQLRSEKSLVKEALAKFKAQLEAAKA